MRKCVAVLMLALAVACSDPLVVRIGDVQELHALEAVLAARRSLRGLVDVTAVAMPRLLTGVAGADGLAARPDGWGTSSLSPGCRWFHPP